jgi:putative membrane protein
MNLLIRWIAATAAVAVAVHFLPGLEYDGRTETLFVAAAVLGLMNALVRPLLKMLACGIIALTLGLFLLVINAAMLLLAAWFSTRLGFHFQVDGWLWAIIGSVVISLVSWAISTLLGDKGRKR